MRTYNSLSLRQVWHWQKKSILIFASLSAIVVILEELTVHKIAVLPDTLVAVLGSAIGIYVSFRTNSAYDRWWEARKLWGQLVNSSRHFAAQVLGYVGNDSEVARKMVMLHVLYVHALRVWLRGYELKTDAHVLRVADELHESLDDLNSSATTTLLRRQLTTLANLQPALPPLRMHSLDQTLAVLLDVQGGCERIRNTPLPPGYGYIAELLIRGYAVILPLALVDELNWLALPVAIVVCLGFKLISEVGRVLEDPFTNRWEGLPLLTLSHTIERDLREALGLPAPPAPAPAPSGVVL